MCDAERTRSFLVVIQLVLSWDWDLGSLAPEESKRNNLFSLVLRMTFPHGGFSLILLIRHRALANFWQYYGASHRLRHTSIVRGSRGRTLTLLKSGWCCFPSQCSWDLNSGTCWKIIKRNNFHRINCEHRLYGKFIDYIVLRDCLQRISSFKKLWEAEAGKGNCVNSFCKVFFSLDLHFLEQDHHICILCWFPTRLHFSPTWEDICTSCSWQHYLQ